MWHFPRISLNHTLSSNLIETYSTYTLLHTISLVCLRQGAAFVYIVLERETNREPVNTAPLLRQAEKKKQDRWRIDAGLVLLLDDLVSVTDLVQWELFIGLSHIIVWVGRNVLETVVSIIWPFTHRATVEIYLLTPAKLVKLLTPLKTKRERRWKAAQTITFTKLNK